MESFTASGSGATAAKDGLSGRSVKMMEDETEVIGNIHDNPELLEVE